MPKQDARKLPRKDLLALRRKVVNAVINKGMKTIEAIRLFGVGKTALFGWL